MTLANRQSRCEVCDEWIYEGDQIEFSDAEQEWVHRHCAEELEGNR